MKLLEMEAKKMTKKMTTKVIFRVWKETGSVIALFPELAADNDGDLCDSYEHIGQHGGADYNGIIQATRPAKPAEYAALAKELRSAPYSYKLEICKRATPLMHKNRKAAIKEEYQRFEGTVDVCCHNVSFWYDITGYELTEDLESVLTEEAENRAKSMITEGYYSGELNCLWQGEDEIRGWWKIEE